MKPNLTLFSRVTAYVGRGTKFLTINYSLFTTLVLLLMVGGCGDKKDKLVSESYFVHRDEVTVIHFNLFGEYKRIDKVDLIVADYVDSLEYRYRFPGQDSLFLCGYVEYNNSDSSVRFMNDHAILINKASYGEWEIKKYLYNNGTAHPYELIYINDSLGIIAHQDRSSLNYSLYETGRSSLTSLLAKDTLFFNAFSNDINVP